MLELYKNLHLHYRALAQDYCHAHQRPLVLSRLRVFLSLPCRVFSSNVIERVCVVQTWNNMEYSMASPFVEAVPRRVEDASFPEDVFSKFIYVNVCPGEH